MANPTIISEQPIMLAELKEELKTAKKRDKELNFRGNKTEEYLIAATSLKGSEAKDLYEKIEKLKIPRLKEIHIMKIVDLLPKTLDSLKIILQGYTLTVNQDNQKKIVKVVSDFVK
ncbi:MAG: hypothetical protein ABIH34_07225 [Nanoarchaeota archaeon]